MKTRTRHRTRRKLKMDMLMTFLTVLLNLLLASGEEILLSYSSSPKEITIPGAECLTPEDGLAILVDIRDSTEEGGVVGGEPSEEIGNIVFTVLLCAGAIVTKAIEVSGRTSNGIIPLCFDPKPKDLANVKSAKVTVTSDLVFDKNISMNLISHHCEAQPLEVLNQTLWIVIVFLILIIIFLITAFSVSLFFLRQQWKKGSAAMSRRQSQENALTSEKTEESGKLLHGTPANMDDSDATDMANTSVTRLIVNPSTTDSMRGQTSFIVDPNQQATTGQTSFIVDPGQQQTTAMCKAINDLNKSVQKINLDTSTVIDKSLRELNSTMNTINMSIHDNNAVFQDSTARTQNNLEKMITANYVVANKFDNAVNKQRFFDGGKSPRHSQEGWPDY